MNKYYIFMASAAINREYFEDALNSLGVPYELTYNGPDRGFLIADENFFEKIDGVLLPLHSDLGLVISILVAHEYSSLEEKAIKEAVAYFPNQALFLTDVLMKEFSFGDFSSVPLLSAELKDVPHDLLLTAGTYLRCGLDASKAAEKLIVHRNTFTYRLNQFVERTGLDIRDYHNALLLEIFFQLGSGK
ncbi:MAG: helix-turn-helix domain-containing protein [Undibacterium sp.]